MFISFVVITLLYGDWPYPRLPPARIFVSCSSPGASLISTVCMYMYAALQFCITYMQLTATVGDARKCRMHLAADVPLPTSATAIRSY